MGALWVLSTLVASAGMRLEIEFSLWLPDAKSVQPENWKGGGKVTFTPPRCACVSVCVSV